MNAIIGIGCVLGFFGAIYLIQKKKGKGKVYETVEKLKNQ